MRTKAGLQRRCGVGAVGKTSLKDMKVLIGQRETNRFMREEDARGMAKRSAFVEVQIKRQEKRARNE